MVYQLNPDVTSCGAAPIPEVVSWVQSYKASQDNTTRPLIHLAPGHPSHLPAQEFVDRVAQSAKTDEVSHYGLGEGDDRLRKALLAEMKDLYADEGNESSDKRSVPISMDNIVITLGANQAIYVALQTLAKAGDEVILCEPYYFNMHMALEQLGLRPVRMQLSAENGFLPSVEACEQLITPRTKAVMIVSPCNPTGAVLPSALAEDFAKMACRRNIAFMLDETYRDLLPNNWEGCDQAGKRARPHTLFGKAAEGRIGAHWSDYLIHIYSFSKSYAIPGYRLGALVASPKLLEQALKIIDTQTICPTQVAQNALAWAIPTTLDWRQDMRADLNNRLKVFCDSVANVKGWKVGSAGGFYAWVQHPFENAGSAEVVKAMVAQCGVSALPGEFFAPAGSPAGRRWMRFSVPNVDVETIKEVAPRLSLLKL